MHLLSLLLVGHFFTLSTQLFWVTDSNRELTITFITFKNYKNKDNHIGLLVLTSYLKFQKRYSALLIIYRYAFVCVCMYVHIRTHAYRDQKRTSDILGLGLEATVNSLLCVLGTQLRSCWVVHTSNDWAISLAPEFFI